jgi:hypothetical protein
MRIKFPPGAKLINDPQEEEAQTARYTLDQASGTVGSRVAC